MNESVERALPLLPPVVIANLARGLVNAIARVNGEPPLTAKQVDDQTLAAGWMIAKAGDGLIKYVEAQRVLSGPDLGGDG